jgi:hypothetical protein
MTFRKNYLPSQTQPWAREVQTRIQKIERDVVISDINNRTRDDQLQASYNRLDRAFVEVAIAAEQAGLAAEAAADAAEDAQDAADVANGIINNIYTPNTTNIAGGKISNGTIAIDKLVSGTITGDVINGGTITGVLIQGSTIRTSQTGQRVTIGGDAGDTIIFNSANDESAGAIFGTYYDDVPAMQIQGGGHMFISAAVNRTIYLNGPTQIFGGLTLGNLTASGSSTFSNTLFNTGAPSTSNDPNVYLTSAGRFERSSAGTTKEIKQNIRDLEFNAEDFISINPVVFDYKEGIVSDDSGTGVIGFIAEDFEDAGFDQLISGPEITGDYKSLRYNKMYMFLHKVVQEQQETIKSLEARIEALETK